MIFLGIDVGTTNTKVIAYDAALGRTVAQSGSRTPATSTPEGAGRRADEVRDLVLALIAKVVGELADPARIAGMAVASVGEEIVLLDERDRPIGETIAWHDPRGRDEAIRLLADRPDLWQGFPPDPTFSLFKLAWLRSHRPEELARAVRLLDVSGYILRSLGGEAAMDWSHASRTGLFDIVGARWDGTIIDSLELDPTLLPRLVPSGTPLGTVGTDLAGRLGLPGEVTVVAGGHDHFCGAYASGIHQAGEVFLSAGTSEAMLTLADRPRPGLNGTFPIEQGRFVDDRHCYFHVALPSGHYFRRWVDLLFSGVQEDAVYAELETVPPGSEGVAFLVRPGSSDAAFVGLSATTGRATILRAMLEGLAIASLGVIRQLGVVSGVQTARIVVTGRASRRALWRGIRASVSGGELVAVDEAEAAALGAALLAQRGVTGRVDAVRADRSWRATDAQIATYAEIVALYQRRFEGWQAGARRFAQEDAQ